MLPKPPLHRAEPPSPSDLSGKWSRAFVSCTVMCQARAGRRTEEREGYYSASEAPTLNSLPKTCDNSVPFFCTSICDGGTWSPQQELRAGVLT